MEPYGSFGALKIAQDEEVGVQDGRESKEDSVGNCGWKGIREITKTYGTRQSFLCGLQVSINQ